MTNNSEKKLFLEGIILEIKSIKYIPIHEWNGVCGPGSSSSIKGYVPSTTIVLESEKNSQKEINYRGIILPDSIGNKIEIYHEITIKNQGHKFLEHKIENQDNIIYDTKLNRWYE